MRGCPFSAQQLQEGQAMTLVDLYTRSVNSFVDKVHAVGDDQWSASTPCADWNVRELVNHIVYEQLWSAPLFDGATIAEVGDRFEGDVLGHHPQGAATQAGATATQAVAAPGAMERIVHLSFGDTPADEYVTQLLADHLIHGWDLAVGIGADRGLDPEAVAFLMPWFAEREEIYRAGGVIGPRVEVGPEATDADRLLAGFGRDPRQ
jgi:uncharacterized protein (TIGR03086 family)